uniref:Uncharacterized protein n=1 Tax=Parastrongyloides trichosuri TaxID=131310 RepID=A0A0N4ZCA9_PARTI
MESEISNLTSDILRMGDYRIVPRSRSCVALRARSVEPSTKLLLTRTTSIPDFTAHIRASNKYKPTWPYWYTRDLSLYDEYWYDKYYYFSPLYRTSFFPRRYYYSDYIPNPYYWNPTYWTKYKGYWYDSDIPYFYRRWYSPSYNYYTWYRSYPHYTALRDATSSSFANGLEMYRNGRITYDCLSRYWLTPSYWDRRYRYWTDLTPVSSAYTYYTPSYYQRRARDLYLTYY